MTPSRRKQPNPLKMPQMPQIPKPPAESRSERPRIASRVTDHSPPMPTPNMA
jgi:hypothetical protein